MARSVNAAALSLIQQYEGFVDHWYPDPAHGWKVPTCCYGHTDAAGPPKYAATKNKKFTKTEGVEILRADLGKYAAAVTKAVKVPLNDNEFGALTSFCFNLGPGNLQKSTLVKKLNAGDRAGAANEFGKWAKAGGKSLPGLIKRRAAERALFLKPVKPTGVHGIMQAIETPAASMGLSLNDRGPVIAELKKNLNALGYGPLTEDDIYDDATKAEVEAFQAGHKGEDGKPLKIDGIAGTRTSKAIQAALLAPEMEQAEKSVPAAATAEVKEKTGWLGKATAWITGASAVGAPAVASEAFQADWRTIVAIGGLVLAGGLVTGLVVLLLRRWLIAAFKDINASIKEN